MNQPAQLDTNQTRDAKFHQRAKDRRAQAVKDGVCAPGAVSFREEAVELVVGDLDGDHPEQGMTFAHVTGPRGAFDYARRNVRGPWQIRGQISGRNIKNSEGDLSFMAEQAVVAPDMLLEAGLIKKLPPTGLSFAAMREWLLDAANYGPAA